MKTVILAAGRGIRIRQYNLLPKCLLKIGDEQILGRTIRILKQSRINDIIVVSGYREEILKELYPDLTYISNPFYNVTNTLASLLLGLTAQNFSEDIIVINGDTVFEDSLIEKLLSIEDNAFAVQKIKPTGEEVKVRIDTDGKIINIGKWLVNSDLEAVGVYKLHPSLAYDVYQTGGLMSDFFKVYYEDAFDRVIRHYNVEPVFTAAEDIDTWDDYQKARERFE
ncbi:MAG: NTP transferase domain-containing protein [Syntrophomonadaceae bacterium]|nr:NTP transferase domain-containing protein [Syntrophomonadaceae bacterium]